MVNDAQYGSPVKRRSSIATPCRITASRAEANTTVSTSLSNQIARITDVAATTSRNRSYIFRNTAARASRETVSGTTGVRPLIGRYRFL